MMLPSRHVGWQQGEDMVDTAILGSGSKGYFTEGYFLFTTECTHYPEY